MCALEQAIRDIGNRIVHCEKRCEGAAIDLRAGIIPRCLILEEEERKGQRGSTIVGMNPGRAKRETRERCKGKASYESWLKLWHNKIRGYRYYKHLRFLADRLGLNGPILWTELAKCETKTGLRQLPIQTLRVCANTYLKEEVALTSADWPIIAVGREAYKALSYLFPTRTVVGIPHVTGSRGQFWSMFTNKDSVEKRHLKPRFKSAFHSLRRLGERGTALWLPGAGQRRKVQRGQSS